jgi:hypothetical protein
VDRNGVGEGRGLEVDVETAVEPRARLAIEAPASGSVERQRHLPPARGRAAAHLRPLRSPVAADLERVVDAPRLAGLDRGGLALEAEPLTALPEEDRLEPLARVLVPPSGEARERRKPGHRNAYSEKRPIRPTRSSGKNSSEDLNGSPVSG